MDLYCMHISQEFSLILVTDLLNKIELSFFGGLTSLQIHLGYCHVMFSRKNKVYEAISLPHELK